MENKKIVIDADILRSSGTTEHPISSASRKVLQAVLDSACFAVVNEELENEWKQHSSRVAIGWRASMRSKSKIIRCAEGNFYYSIVHDSGLEEKLRRIALKDSHLVTLAIGHDKIVTSNDDRARKAFCNLCGERTELGQIFWVNVTNNSAEIINALCNKYQTLNDDHRLSSIE
ncbi:hypothetical protein [Pectobacterium carotovorum]|uniref:hypothetical protein n=1 Tax=Pectobacterium carotovorum TaxID=554 RepID=UPI0015E02076|nr:hypothetical protein [Pectobacterium carotovorum]MBA0180358.1 hypothetical protein [Pectobacterium carotovorum]MCA6974448.1 hypothetical protein [Pectobacterium carotovorum]